MAGQEEEFRVFITDDANTSLKKFAKPVAERIKKKIERLSCIAPARTLKKHPDIFVLEIGDYRALYLVDEKAKAKTVFFIADHKDYERRYNLMWR